MNPESNYEEPIMQVASLSLDPNPGVSNPENTITGGQSTTVGGEDDGDF